ncbi:hypothetical protein ABZU94_30310 [Streptomyces mirabilis]|uniref:hypothetical protein n=1 Tax=Streptomyces sp. NPDC005388 TaxID=3156717 RepID=UPI0033B1A9AC
MQTRTARGIAATLSTAAILTATASQVSAAEATQTVAKQSDPAATPAAYANYLCHSHEDGAADALREFQHLTRAEQAKLIGYLHDPALLKSFLDKTADQGKGMSAYSRNTSSTTSLRNGDVTIGQESTVSGLSVAAAHPLPKGNHTVTYTTYVKYFGIKVIKLSLWENFHSNGRDITKVNYADAGKKNLSGVINLSKGTPKKVLSEWRWCPRGGHCTSGHNADASVVWEGSVVFGGSVFQVDKEQWMRADVYGKLINYSLKNV